MIKRQAYLDEISLHLPQKDKILFLIGARQVGKTTLLKSLTEFSLLDPERTLFLSGDEITSLAIDSYQGFIEYISIEKHIEDIDYLILDESQYILNIGLILKILIDKVKGGTYDFKIIVSGSGSLDVFTGITDSLIGRKHIIYVTGFSFQEFLQTKGISYLVSREPGIIQKYLHHFHEYILYGGYPDVVLAKDKYQKFALFKSLFDDYIFKDVQLLLDKKDIIKFTQFLKILASKVGSYINMSTLVEELGISRYILEKYFFVVENTFLLQRVSPWYGGKFQNEIKKKYKIYFKDIGMLRYLLGMSDWIGDFKGKIIENFVCNEVMRKKKNYQALYFWGTSDGGEVDFVLEDQVNFSLYPIEVKSANKTNIPKSFSNFLERYADKISEGMITTEKTSSQRGTITFCPYIYNVTA